MTTQFIWSFGEFTGTMCDSQEICERLVLFSGPRRFLPFVTMPYAPTPRLLMLQLFLDIYVFFARASLP